MMGELEHDSDGRDSAPAPPGIGSMSTAVQVGAATRAGAGQEEAEIPLDQMRLVPGDPMQLQPLRDGVQERYNVRIIGLLKNKSIVVTTPVVDDKVLFVRDGQLFLVRTFSGLNACGFRDQVLKSAMTPYPHLHLSYPATVRAMRIRKAMRATVNIIVALYEREGGQLIASGLMLDLSLGGARVQTHKALGEVGHVLHMSFKIVLDGVEEIVSVSATVRSVSEDTDDGGQRAYIMGLQFGDIAPAHKVVIMALVYQHLVKEA